jgi:hypothetical protein
MGRANEREKGEAVPLSGWRREASDVGAEVRERRQMREEVRGKSD